MTVPPPRVLHLHFGKEGGAERFLVTLAQGLAERGVEQRFVVRPGVSWRSDVAALGEVVTGHGRRFSPATPLLRWRLARMARDWRPDALLAWMPRAARMLPAGGTALRLARLGDFPDDLAPFARCDAIVGNLPGIAERCRALGWTGATRTITNFARPTTPRPVPRDRHGTPEDAFLVVAGGRFVARKGLDVAIRAVARLDGAWLWLIGDGRERAALEALAAELGVTDRVRFLGWVAEAVHPIAAADAFLLPSRHEPLGNMLLEAWGAGVPSVATRSEGPDWYMRGGRDGVLVEVDDVAGVAAGLAAIRDDPARAARYAASAAARLEEMFGREAVLDRYVALFAAGRAGLAR